MAGPALIRDLASWSSSESSKVIQYSITVLDQIDAAVTEGFNRLKGGGVEIGGILFGVNREDRVTVEAFRPVPCEHVFGPMFELSEKDHEAFCAVLGSGECDEALHGLIPVGWYRSRIRSAIHLSGKDLELFARYFPEAWQVALVLKPDSAAVTRAGFFFREADGLIRNESSYLEFKLSPKFQENEELRGQSPPKAATPLPVIETNESPLVSPAPSLTPPRSRSNLRRLKLFSLAVPLAILVLGGIRILDRRSASPLPSAKPSLTVQGRGRQLRILWDGMTLADSRSQNASLEIRDGDRTSWVPLRADELPRGSVLYARSAEIVVVHMKVGSTEEWTTFVGALPTPPPLEAAQDREAEARLREQADQITRLQEMVTALHSAKAPVSKSAAFGSAQKKAPIRAFVPPIIKKSRVLEMLAPPPIEFPAPVPTPAAFARAIASPPPPVSLPKTGALIWTGRLAKAGVIRIEGGKASIGSLTGEIPGFPIRLRVYPGDLTEDGLTMFTSESNRPARRVEPPGPQNGWNKTSYLVNGVRAKAVSILEAPASENGWKRLILSSDGSAIGLILIKWDAL